MAGIYDRIGTSDNVSVHLLMSLITAVGEGDITGVQARTIINNELASPLTAAEETDLTNILTELGNQAGVANKLRYLNLVHSYTMMIEFGVTEITETILTTRLGI